MRGLSFLPRSPWFWLSVLLAIALVVVLVLWLVPSSGRTRQVACFVPAPTAPAPVPGDPTICPVCPTCPPCPAERPCPICPVAPVESVCPACPPQITCPPQLPCPACPQCPQNIPCPVQDIPLPEPGEVPTYDPLPPAPPIGPITPPFVPEVRPDDPVPEGPVTPGPPGYEGRVITCWLELGRLYQVVDGRRVFLTDARYNELGRPEPLDLDCDLFNRFQLNLEGTVITCAGASDETALLYQVRGRLKYPLTAATYEQLGRPTPYRIRCESVDAIETAPGTAPAQPIPQATAPGAPAQAPLEWYEGRYLSCGDNPRPQVYRIENGRRIPVTSVVVGNAGASVMQVSCELLERFPFGRE